MQLPSPPGRDSEVAALRAALAASPVALLVGPAGGGRTSVAAAVAGPDAVGVDLAGCEDAGDALRAVGAAIGAVPIGLEREVLERLAGRAPACLLADDVTSEAVVDQLHRLATSVPGVRVVAVAEAGTVDGAALGLPAVELGLLPLDVLAAAFPGVEADECDGLPLVAELAVALGVPARAVRATLAARVGDGGLAMGIPGAAPASVPREALHPGAGRTTLRSGVLALLGGGGRRGLPGPPVLAQALSAVTPLLSLAHGAHLPAPPDPRDILLLRALSRVVPGTDGTRCAAAGARLLAAAGQVSLARGLLGAHPATTGVERGLLGWADGDAILASGDIDGALARWREAAEQLRRAGARSTRAHFLRRAADRLAARHQLEAEPLFRLARNAYRAADERPGVAAALRGIADLSVANGELVGAATLHDEVERLLGELDPTSPAARLERANLLLGQATLSLARGELARAERILDALAPIGAEHPLVGANVARRRVEALLRRGALDEARTLAVATADTYATLGEPVAQAKALRLAGEAAAATGDLDAATSLLHRAQELHIGAQDLRGLARTLGRLALVADAQGDASAARRRREQVAAVRAVVGG